MKKKKGKRVFTLLLAIVGCIVGLYSAREPVQAAENITGIDLKTAQNLWNVTLSWDNIYETANLTTVETGGFTQKADTGTLIYMEAPGILGYPDTTSWIRATYDKVGTIGGRSVSVQVTFRSFYGKKDTHALSAEWGDHCSTYNDIRGCVDMQKSGVALNKCFWHGFSQHDIYAMGEEYHLYFTDTGEGISCKGAYLTASSLNKGEGITYNTEGQDGGNLNTFLRTDHQLQNDGYGSWVGNSDDFPDDPRAADYTKNSVCFQLCTDDPKFLMRSEGCDYWHTFNVSPLGATIPEQPNKVGVTSAGVQMDKFTNVNVGDTLMFDVSQKVEYLTVTGSVKYQQFQIIDTLPQELTYSSANVTDENGNMLNSSQVNITVNSSNQVIAEFTSDYLQNGMRYAGETYHLHVAAQVNANAANSSKFVNQGYTIINNTMSSFKKVEIEPRHSEPALSIEKTVPKYEYQVGDTVEYTIKVNQTVADAVAQNVKIQDTSLPEGLAVSDAADAVTVNAPQTWTDASGGTHQTAVSTKKQGNGFVTTVDGLNYNAPVTIKVKCTAKDAVNGKEVKNTVTAQADNVKTPVSANAKVFINSPKLAIHKQVPKYEWQVGDTIEYTIQVSQTAQNCVARNVKIQDTSLPEGLAVSDAADAVTVDAPKNWTDVGGTTHQTAVSTKRQGTGFVTTLDGLNYNAPVTIKVKCVAKDSVNGKKITNTVTAQADNAKTQVKDQARVFINSPKLNMEKTVSKYEWRVGDTVEYTIKISQTIDGCQARNVRIKDLTLPDGLEIQPEMADWITVDAPKSWTEPETGAVKSTVVESGQKDGGFEVTLDRLEKGTATIKVKCVAKDAVNGKEIVNTAKAQADNVKAPLSATAKIYVNSPGVHIEKECDKSYAKPGDVIGYTLSIDNETIGTLARNIVITDTIETEGLKLQKNSIVLLDADGNPIKDAKITVKDNSFRIETGKTMICMDGNYEVLDKEKGDSDGGKPNPEGVDKEKAFTVEYQASATKKVEEGGMLENKATVTCDEGTSDEDEASVPVNGPVLDLRKTSDKENYQVGATGHYKLTVREPREALTAKAVIITDAFTDTGMTIAPDSIVTELNGEAFEPESVEVNETKNGFTIKTGKDITDTDKLVIRYDVTFDGVTAGNTYANVAIAKGSNTAEAKDRNEITADSGEKPELIITKKAAKEEVKVGDTDSFEIKVTQDSHYVSAKNVVIQDSFDKPGASYVRGTMKILDSQGKDITKDVIITYTEHGFRIDTKRDLGYNEFFKITYDMEYTDASLAGQTVMNQAAASSDNTEEAATYAEVKVRTDDPELVVKKTAEKSTVHIGDTNTYTIVVTQTKEGETAKDVVIQDSLNATGVEYVKETFRLTDKDGSKVEGTQTVFSGNGFVMKTGKDLGYMETLTLTYQVKYTDASLVGKTVQNTAVVPSGNGKENPGKTDVVILDDDPQLEVKKTAEKSTAHIGDTNGYTITVRQIKEGETAKAVVIRDSLNTEGVEYVKDSFRLADKDGNEVEGTQIVFSGNSFVMKTGKDLGYMETLTLTYQVKYTDTALAGKTVKNTVSVQPGNGKEVPGEAPVDILDDDPELSVTKTAERTEVRAGETNTYTITVKQTKEGATAKKIVIRDTLDAGGSYVKTSFRLVDQDGNKVNGVKGIFTGNNGFRIKVGQELSYGKAYVLTYQVTYAESVAGGSVKNTVVVKADQTDEKTAEQVVAVKAADAQTVTNTQPAQENTTAGAPADTTKKSSAPQTGLHDHIRIYAILGAGFIAAGIGFAVYFYRKRKKK